MRLLVNVSMYGLAVNANVYRCAVNVYGSRQTG